MVLAQLHKKGKKGNSLVVQCLVFCAFTARAWVQSLVGELRSCMPHGVAKNKLIEIGKDNICRHKSKRPNV